MKVKDLYTVIIVLSVVVVVPVVSESGTYWAGLIDDVRIYNRVVIPQKVAVVAIDKPVDAGKESTSKPANSKRSKKE